MRYFSLLSLVYCAQNVVGEVVVVGNYVPNLGMLPKKISYNKVTHINYIGDLFSKPDDPSFLYLEDRDYRELSAIKVKGDAVSNKVKVLITVGRWHNSQNLSYVARNDTHRAKYINNLLQFVRNNSTCHEECRNKFNLDGIILDWQHLELGTARCNMFTSNDSDDYLILLKQLRDALDKEFQGSKLLIANVLAKPFDGHDCKPKTIVSEYNKYFDFVSIMPYDIMSLYSYTTGPNLSQADATKGGYFSTFTQAIDDWLAAGFPASNLIAGLAFYGRSYFAKTDMNGTLENMCQPKESESSKGDSSNCNQPKLNVNGKFYTGVSYKSLYFDALSSPTNDYIRHYDNVTQNPWLFHSETKKFILYDDPRSLEVKVNYAKKKELGGVMCWTMPMDHEGELLNAANLIREAH